MLSATRKLDMTHRSICFAGLPGGLGAGFRVEIMKRIKLTFLGGCWRRH